MEKASFDQEVNTLSAEAELAYELQVSSQIDNLPLYDIYIYF